jgi:hypothetical protein
MGESCAEVMPEYKSTRKPAKIQDLVKVKLKNRMQIFPRFIFLDQTPICLLP